MLAKVLCRGGNVLVMDSVQEYAIEGVRGSPMNQIYEVCRLATRLALRHSQLAALRNE